MVLYDDCVKNALSLGRLLTNWHMVAMDFDGSNK